MFPKGIIYKKGFPLYGSKKLRASFRVRLLFAFFQTCGIFLIAGSVLYVIYSFTPLAKEEVVYAISQISNAPSDPKFAIVNPLPTPEPEISKRELRDAEYAAKIQRETGELGINSSFSVVVPKIKAKANVIENVDPGNEKVYLKALENGVAHAAGTFFPGQGKLIYLFSHSTNSPLYAARLDAVFYLLRKLEKGDEIVVYFADKRHIYLVTDIVITKPGDTSWLKDKGEGETLILQTCTPPGTNWKRLLVIAKPV